VAERSLGIERGSLEFTVRTPKAGSRPERNDRFRSTAIDTLVFLDDPAFTASKREPPTAASRAAAATRSRSRFVIHPAPP
jgi:hypothetical protein